MNFHPLVDGAAAAQVRWRFQARVRPSSTSASCRKLCSDCVADRATSRALMDAACFWARNCGQGDNECQRRAQKPNRATKCS